MTGLEVASGALSLASAALDGLNKLTSSSAISNKVEREEGMASGALSLAGAALDGLNKLTSSSAISNKVAAQLGVESDLAFIRDEFAMMRAFLKTADGKAKKRGGKVIPTWVRQVRVLAYDVEDCLADSAMHLDRRQSWSRLPRSTKARQHRIAGEIKKLRARVEDVSNRNLRYRLINDDAGPSQSQPSTGGAADYYVGEQHSDRQLESRPITDLISGGGDALQVISVWGSYDQYSASISVVRDAYEKQEEASFKWRAWVNVARPFNHHEFLKSLLRHFYTTTSSSRAGGMEAMIKAEKMAEGTTRIREEFESLVMDKENKFLFVLDNLDDAEVWLWIKTCLPCHRNGSRIIVRTQQLGIALLCPEQPIKEAEAELNELLDGYSPICLFFNKALGKGGSDPTFELQATGDTRKQVDEWISAALEENSLVGREADASKVINLLLTAESQEYIVVSGVDGIGKTALVKSICQSQELSRKFERPAWFPVRDTFNRHEFIRTVTQQWMDSKKARYPFSTNMANKWTNIIKGSNNVPQPDAGSSKGLLLILDDVSSMKQLQRIRSALSEARINIGRVIIITKEPGIAENYIKGHKLQPLEPEYAFELFQKKVKVCKDLFQLSKDIVNKCNGHPEAINIVAAYLQKADIKEWKRFYEHFSNTKLKNIDNILDAVYMSLPYNLKSCFLYLSVFPKDRKIRRRRLVRRCIAEGFSSEDHGTTVKHVAEKQFQGLIDRNLIHPSGTSAKISNSGETHLFEFKNLMHRISRKKSAEENLVLILDEDEHSTFQGEIKARHLTVMSTWNREGMNSNTLESRVDLSCIRSLTVFGECKSFFISKKMRMLRVLDLEDTYSLRDHDLSSLGKLYHLRYLSLRGSIGIFHLPDSIGNLPYLETLDVRGTMVTKLPKTIVKLQKLKYLRAGIISWDEDDTGGSRMIRPLIYYLIMFFKICSKKETDYAGMEELDLKVWVPLVCLMVTVWLKGLDPCGVKAPKRIGGLKALHTLGVVNVAVGKTILKEIQKLTQLHKLGITGVNMNHCEDLELAISNQRDLRSLFMRAQGENGLKGCLDSMSPPEQLESLKLHGSLEKLPRWLGKLHSLVKLTLRSTMLKQGSVELLGKLQNLTSLRLLDKSFQGEVLQFQTGFENMMVLGIGGLYNVKSVKFAATAMPKLKLLKVACWWDTEVCSFIGIDVLLSLKEVLLSGLSEEDLQESDLESEEQLVHRAFKDEMLKQLKANKNKPELKMDY